jgi:4-amino-4-deoxy-L-arabinose transferase-like glycosyltransferase
MALTLGFIAVTAVWLAFDHRIPTGDPTRHLEGAYRFLEALRDGDPLAPVRLWRIYPPAVQSVGALGMLVGGQRIWSAVMAMNLVFVPLLALGCYRTALLVYGDARAGLLAVAFALGTPMVISQFHVFMLDAGETAMVAVSVWLLLASRNFQQTRYAALAGLAVGFGLLTKQTFVWFPLGVVLVMLARGGWRQWRGLLLFALLALVVAGPWYVEHADELRTQAEVASLESANTESGTQAPRRYSLENAQWYFWSAVNYQYRLPLLLFAMVGTVLAAVRVARRDRRHPLVVELLVGGFLGWLGLTWTLSHEPRYVMPLLVYVAVLGTGWILFLPRAGRVVAQTVLALLVVASFAGAAFGLGPTTIELRFPNAPSQSESYVLAGHFTLYSNDGFVFGKPERGGDLIPIMRDLHAQGARSVRWYPTLGQTVWFNIFALNLVANLSGLEPLPVTDAQLGPGEVGFENAPLGALNEPPCERLADGSGIWVLRGLPGGRVVDACPRGGSG